jgi:hypothetical protein
MIRKIHISDSSHAASSGEFKFKKGHPGRNVPVTETIEKKQREGGKTWQRKDTKSNRNALNADVA